MVYSAIRARIYKENKIKDILKKQQSGVVKQQTNYTQEQLQSMTTAKLKTIQRQITIPKKYKSTKTTPPEVKYTNVTPTPQKTAGEIIREARQIQKQEGGKLTSAIEISAQTPIQKQLWRGTGTVTQNVISAPRSVPVPQSIVKPLKPANIPEQETKQEQTYVPQQFIKQIRPAQIPNQQQFIPEIFSREGELLADVQKEEKEYEMALTRYKQGGTIELYAQAVKEREDVKRAQEAFKKEESMRISEQEKRREYYGLTPQVLAQEQKEIVQAYPVNKSMQLRQPKAGEISTIKIVDKQAVSKVFDFADSKISIENVDAAQSALSKSGLLTKQAMEAQTTKEVYANVPQADPISFTERKAVQQLKTKIQDVKDIETSKTLGITAGVTIATAGVGALFSMAPATSGAVKVLSTSFARGALTTAFVGGQSYRAASAVTDIASGKPIKGYSKLARIGGETIGYGVGARLVQTGYAAEKLKQGATALDQFGIKFRQKFGLAKESFEDFFPQETFDKVQYLRGEAVEEAPQKDIFGRSVNERELKIAKQVMEESKIGAKSVGLEKSSLKSYDVSGYSSKVTQKTLVGAGERKVIALDVTKGEVVDVTSDIVKIAQADKGRFIFETIEPTDIFRTTKEGAVVVKSQSGIRRLLFFKDSFIDTSKSIISIPKDVQTSLGRDFILYDTKNADFKAILSPYKSEFMKGSKNIVSFAKAKPSDIDTSFSDFAGSAEALSIYSKATAKPKPLNLYEDFLPASVPTSIPSVRISEPVSVFGSASIDMVGLAGSIISPVTGVSLSQIPKSKIETSGGALEKYKLKSLMDLKPAFDTSFLNKVNIDVSAVVEPKIVQNVRAKGKTKQVLDQVQIPVLEPPIVTTPNEQPPSYKPPKVPKPIVPPTPPPPFKFDWDFPKPKRFKKAFRVSKPLSIRRGFAPSFAGLASGKFQFSEPKLVSGVGIRLPVASSKSKKKKKKKKKKVMK